MSLCPKNDCYDSGFTGFDSLIKGRQYYFQYNVDRADGDVSSQNTAFVLIKFKAINREQNVGTIISGEPTYFTSRTKDARLQKYTIEKEREDAYFYIERIVKDSFFEINNKTDENFKTLLDIEIKPTMAGYIEGDFNKPEIFVPQTKYVPPTIFNSSEPGEGSVSNQPYIDQSKPQSNNEINSNVSNIEMNITKSLVNSLQQTIPNVNFTVDNIKDPDSKEIMSLINKTESNFEPFLKYQEYIDSLGLPTGTIYNPVFLEEISKLIRNKNVISNPNPLSLIVNMYKNIYNKNGVTLFDNNEVNTLPRVVIPGTGVVETVVAPQGSPSVLCIGISRSKRSDGGQYHPVFLDINGKTTTFRTYKAAGVVYNTHVCPIGVQNGFILFKNQSIPCNKPNDSRLSTTTTKKTGRALNRFGSSVGNRISSTRSSIGNRFRTNQSVNGGTKKSNKKTHKKTHKKAHKKTHIKTPKKRVRFY
jgi:uncharacterized protein (UPF0297 family)